MPITKLSTEKGGYSARSKSSKHYQKVFDRILGIADDIPWTLRLAQAMKIMYTLLQGSAKYKHKYHMGISNQIQFMENYIVAEEEINQALRLKYH